MHKIKHALQTILLLSLTITTASCGGGSSSSPKSKKTTILATDKSISLPQNNRTTIDLASPTATGAQTIYILQQPQHGIITMNGTIATYRVTEPLYSGADTFTYQVMQGTAVSNAASVNVTVTGIASNQSLFTEDYANGA